MKNVKNNKSLKILLIALGIAATLGLVIFFVRSTSPQYAGGRSLVITNLDVGKADAAIVCYGDITGIIDTGKDDAFDTIDDWLSDHEITSIDYMILTHFDSDHIGSAVRILQSYPVGTVYYPDYVSEKKGYAPLMEELDKNVEGRNAVAVSSKMSVTFDGLELEFMPADDPAPLLAGKKPDNNMSLMCRYDLGSKKLLFTGDVEGDRIEQLNAGNDDVSADWIKLPHHGGYEKCEKEFLKRVSPSFGVISTNSEREADEHLISFLEKHNIVYYITENGNVTTVCDGKSLAVTQE